jgi:cell division protein FtsN
MLYSKGYSIIFLYKFTKLFPFAKSVLDKRTPTASSSASPPNHPPPVSREPVTWRVIAGSFRDRANADKQAARLKKLGIDCFVVEHGV